MKRTGVRMAVCLLLALPALAQGPSAPTQLPNAPPAAMATMRPPVWVRTAPTRDYIPLSNRRKLDVFVKWTYSPLTFLGTAFDAGIAQANADHEEYGQGMQGYGKRLGASLADNESGAFFQRYLLPTIFHQDPRYFRRPELPAGRRAAYAMSRVLLTRKDDGNTALNISYLGGGLMSTALANAYYPFHERGFENTMQRFGAGIVSDAGLLVLHEFWPDLRTRLAATPGVRRLIHSKVGQRVERRVERSSQ